MQRSLGKLFISKSIKYGQRNVAVEALFFRSIATSIGGDSLWGDGEESTTNSVQKQIVDALRLGERGLASTMLSNLDHYSELSTCDFLWILRYCARSPDPLFALETWRVMGEKDVGLNNTSCLLMMQALCKGGYLEEAFNLINFLGEKKGMNPSLAVYNSFLRACSKMCSIVHATKCLDLMWHRMSGKNEVTYMELLKLAVFQQNLSAVHEIWKDYTMLYSPNIFSLQNFVQSFARLRDLNSACKTLQYMVSLALRGNASISSTADGMIYSSRLDIPIPFNAESGLQRFDLKENNEQFIPLKADVFTNNIKWSIVSNHGKEVVNVGLDEAKCIRAMKALDKSFGNVMHACAQTQNCRLAEQLMLQMQILGVEPSSHTYNGFVKAVLPEKSISEGMEVLRTMQQRNLRPFNSTLAILSVACSKNLELDLAEALLGQISNYKHPHPYNAFLEACDTMDQLERALRIWAKMKQLQIRPDIRTYELLFSLFGNVNAPYEDGNKLSQEDCAVRINVIEMDMVKNSVEHSHLSMKNLLKALGAEGMISQLIDYLHVAEDLFYRNNTYFGEPIYNTVLHSLVEAKESDLATKMFKNMKSLGFQLNAATYTTMIDCCSIIQCYKSASAVFSMMLRDGFNPETATYTALIKVLLEDGNIDKALNLLDQGISEGIQPDVLLYNTILRKAWEKGRIDVIELIVEQMDRGKIKPDSVTCNHVFSTYVEHGFHNTAMEALQVLSMRMICDEDDTFQEIKAEFEDEFILSEDQEAESRIIEYFRGRGGEDIAVALLNLRWCAIVGSSISWSPNENLWARRLSRNYDTIKRAAR